MIKQHAQLEEKIHERIYYVMRLLDSGDFDYIDTDYLSHSTIKNSSLAFGEVTVNMYWRDPL